MSIRDFLNERPQAAAVVAIVVLIAALGAVWVSTRGPDLPSSEAYYVDLVTGDLFVADGPADQSPDGNAAAAASVFGCGSCAPDDRFLGYAQREVAPPGEPAGQERVEISADLERWFDYTSPQARAIRRAECPGGALPLRCRP